MAKYGPICTHPALAAIDRAVRSGAFLHTLVALNGLSLSAQSRPPKPFHPPGKPPSFAARSFFMAAIRIMSRTQPIFCGYFPTFLRNLSASIRRASYQDAARHTARPSPSGTATGRARQKEQKKEP